MYIVFRSFKLSQFFQNAWVHFIVIHSKLLLIVAAVELLLNESNYQANWLLGKCLQKCLLSVSAWTLSNHIQFSETIV